MVHGYCMCVHILQSYSHTISCQICILSYGTVVLFIGFRISCPTFPPTNQPDIYFVTTWQRWLGIAKPKNVFRSTPNLCIKKF